MENTVFLWAAEMDVEQMTMATINIEHLYVNVYVNVSNCCLIYVSVMLNLKVERPMLQEEPPFYLM